MKETALKRLTKKFVNFCNTLETSSVSESNIQYQILLKELALFEMGIDKARTICETTERELNSYNQMFVQREESIEQVKKDILVLKEELAQERRIRQNKEQYAQLAKIIAERPPTSVTEKEIEQLQTDLASVTQDTTRTSSKLDLRTKQFQLFLHALSELQRELDDDMVLPEQKQDVEMVDTS